MIISGGDSIIFRKSCHSNYPIYLMIYKKHDQFRIERVSHIFSVAVDLIN